MRLEQNKDNNVIKSVTKESFKVGLDTASSEIIMMILSSNMYSDTIGSPIQEIAANALDSTIMAGNTEPIIISLTKNEAGQWELGIEDLGLGLSKEEFETIMCNFGCSTKRDNDEALGFMG